MESLNVIALISGGKDSFYSLLHCQRNGHTVVALGNLYPPPPPPSENESDLNSFMYQTVGHTVIPLYEEALGIPLYRQEIRGGAVQTALTYAKERREENEDGDEDEDEDETESLVPLLRRIMREHPRANALSTGAILSTYQRTRIESVAARLGLVPLGFLWQYPCLPPHTQISLLEDMEAVGLEARIVKVASAGLDEAFLWEDVVSVRGRGKVERAMRRFGREGDGGVIGEGGEFETLVVDGPGVLFKRRILVKEGSRRVVREGGGAAWLSIESARTEMKDARVVVESECRIPDLLDERFAILLKGLQGEEAASSSLSTEVLPNSLPLKLGTKNPNILTWKFGIEETSPSPLTISEEANTIITSIQQQLAKHSLNSTHIISSVIILRSMSDFAAINKVYSTLFPHPNPPSRVTISSGSLLPLPQNLLIYLSLSPSSPTLRKTLHVQSRSYWAPANIGPYSQAVTYPLFPLTTNTSDIEASSTSIVRIAGQIPLIPSSMLLPSPLLGQESQGHSSETKDFEFQTVLALQHLWRIGVEMSVRWWVGAIAFIPSTTSSTPPPSSSEGTTKAKANTIAKAWKSIHQPPTEQDDDDEEQRDLWEEKYRQGSSALRNESEKRELPDWSLGVHGEPPPIFTAEVQELPRGSGVEWCPLHGISGDVESVVVRTTSSDEKWKIHQTIVNATNIYTIITVYHSPRISGIDDELANAMKFMSVSSKGAKIAELGSATYLDVGIDGIWEHGREWKGKVPCRSLWDAEGRRLGGVWILESLVVL